MKIDINHIAKLANLTLNKKNKNKLEKQLESTLDHIARLNDIDTRNIEPTSQVTGLENITRLDKVTKSLSQNEALSGAKALFNGFFKVRAILEDM